MSIGHARLALLESSYIRRCTFFSSCKCAFTNDRPKNDAQGNDGEGDETRCTSRCNSRQCPATNVNDGDETISNRVMHVNDDRFTGSSDPRFQWCVHLHREGGNPEIGQWTGTGRRDVGHHGTERLVNCLCVAVSRIWASERRAPRCCDR